MNAADRNTAVGVFADRTRAEHAVDALRSGGFEADQIGLVIPDAPDKIEVPPLDPGTKAGEGAAAGAVAGVALGGLLGAALSNLVLPGVGPILVGGLLAAALGGAALGGAGGGLLGALIGMKIPEEEARHYEREFHSGRSLVTVRADSRYEEAVAILRRVAEAPEHREGAPHRGRYSGEGEGRSSGGGAFVPAP